MPSSSSLSVTCTRVAAACFSTLVSASCATRYRQSPASVPGSPRMRPAAENAKAAGPSPSCDRVRASSASRSARPSSPWGRSALIMSRMARLVSITESCASSSQRRAASGSSAMASSAMPSFMLSAVSTCCRPSCNSREMRLRSSSCRRSRSAMRSRSCACEARSVSSRRSSSEVSRTVTSAPVTVPASSRMGTELKRPHQMSPVPVRRRRYDAPNCSVPASARGTLQRSTGTGSPSGVCTSNTAAKSAIDRRHCSRDVNRQKIQKASLKSTTRASASKMAMPSLTVANAASMIARARGSSGIPGVLLMCASVWSEPGAHVTPGGRAPR